jgi:hypothetical protein
MAECAFIGKEIRRTSRGQHVAKLGGHPSGREVHLALDAAEHAAVFDPLTSSVEPIHHRSAWLVGRWIP